MGWLVPRIKDRLSTCGRMQLSYLHRYGRVPVLMMAGSLGYKWSLRLREHGFSFQPRDISGSFRSFLVFLVLDGVSTLSSIKRLSLQGIVEEGYNLQEFDWSSH